MSKTFDEELREILEYYGEQIDLHLWGPMDTEETISAIKALIKKHQPAKRSGEEPKPLGYIVGHNKALSDSDKAYGLEE